MFSNRNTFSDLSQDFGKIQKELNRLFGRTNDRADSDSSFPPVNIWQVDDVLMVETELPGFELADLDISIDGDDRLLLKGTRKRKEEVSGTWHRRERVMGEIRRAIDLPVVVNPAKVEAALKSGVLTISLPRKEEVKPKKIVVKAK